MRKLMIETSSDASIDLSVINDYIDDSSNSSRASDGKYHPLGQAGTDHPWYMDFDIDINAEFEDYDASPFAYFPVNPTNIKELKFFIADEYEDGMVHNELFGGALEEYICNFIHYKFDNGQERFCELMGKFYDNTVEKDGLKYSYDNGVMKFSNEKDSVDFKDVVSEAFHYSGIDLTVPESLANAIYNIFEDSDWDNGEIVVDLIDYIFDHFDLRDDWDQDAVCGMLGIDINGLFNSSRLMGRIWTDKELITFYPGQQPSRDEMRQVISDISDNISISEDELLNFYTIFEVGSKEAYTGSGYKTHDDAQIQCCTVADYIEGKYSGFNRDEEIEMVKNRKGVDRFCPHLANQEQKREFFKDFRKTRDNAVYAPREKAAGSLAAYHAMRYPYGESKDTEGELINEEEYSRSNEAGTDSPYFYDPETDFKIEADNGDDDACPFGYFPYEPYSDELTLYTCEDCYDGDEYDGLLHRNIVNTIVRDLAYQIVTEDIMPHEEDVIKRLDDMRRRNLVTRNNFGDVLEKIFKEVGIRYVPTSDFIYFVAHEVSVCDWSDISSIGIFDDVWQDICDSYDEDYEIGEIFGIDDDEIIHKGRLLGRIWTDKGLITFYPGQQPSRDEMKYLLNDLSPKIGIDYDDLLGFYIIFETGSKYKYSGTGYRMHEDATVQCCTVADYIEGKYDGFNRDEEYEMVKNRKGVEGLNIHLAKPEEKREFFKDFRKTRDNAVYAPRERGAGSLAAYHAMRYPYGESKKANGKLIKEDDSIPRISDSWMSHVDDRSPSSLSSSDFPSVSSSYGSSGCYSSNGGTDFPSFYDKQRGRLYEGFWQDNSAHPFAFFESSPGNLMFHVGGEATTHSGIAYYIAKNYYLKERWDDIRNEVRKVAEGMLDDINKYIANNFYNIEGSQTDLDKAVDKIYEDINKRYRSYARAIVYGAFEGLFGKKLFFIVENKMYFEEEPLYELLYNILIESCGKEGDDMFDNRLYFLGPLFTILGEDYNDYFYRGRLEGRIFIDSELISFYDKQQPTSAELDDIVRRLSKDPEVGVSYDDILSYEIIYKDGNTISGCPVYEYIMKKPLDSIINPDERKGSVFIPHLARPEEKFNFFKGFRDARDKAVYAPREKAAGTLAAYHAMRYPYGENKQARKSLIRENWWGGSSPCAGTDHPYYEDKETGEVYEADWDDGYGFPFGYWPVDGNGAEEFITADYGETHFDVCAKAAEKYFYSIVDDLIYECADEICSAIDDISKDFEEYGYTYDEEEDRYVSSDGSETVTRDELVDRVCDSVYDQVGDVYEISGELIDDFLETNEISDFQEIEEKLRDYIESEYCFYDRDDTNKALSVVGTDFDSFFEAGHSEGRIWPEHEMIGFYDTQQPSPEELERILHDLADYMGYDYEEFMDYHMIYEDWDGEDDSIKLTTLGDYINGPHEEDKQYAKDGKTVFIPHLASPEEKKDFFKDFRNTRDRVKFVPQEKAAGSVAAYHAMRYPFGESKKRIWKQVSEEVDRVLSNQKRVYIKESSLKRIGKLLKKKK